MINAKRSAHSALRTLGLGAVGLGAGGSLARKGALTITGIGFYPIALTLLSIYFNP